MDRRCVNHGLNPRLLFNIGGPLAVINPRPLLCQMSGKLRFMGVRAGYGKSGVQQDLCQPAHTDASDPNKVNVFRFVKIYLIHILFPFPVIRYVFVCFPYNYIKVRRKCHMKL